MDALYWLSNFGDASITRLWIPVLIWTVVAIPILLVTRLVARKQPALHYYAMVVLLGSLLMGFLMVPVWYGINTISPTFSTPELVLPVEATNNGLFLLPGASTTDSESAVAPATHTNLPLDFFFNLVLGGVTIALLFWSLFSLCKLAYRIFITRKMRHTMVVPRGSGCSRPASKS